MPVRSVAVTDGLKWSRQPAGQGRSYPISRKDLDAALEQQPANGLHSVSLAPRSYGTSAGDWFWSIGMKTPAGVTDAEFTALVSASWTGIDGMAPWYPAFSASVHIYTVPATVRASLRDLFVTEILPASLGWIQQIDKGPSTGRTEKRRLALFLSRGSLERAES